MIILSPSSSSWGVEEKNNSLEEILVSSPLGLVLINPIVITTRFVPRIRGSCFEFGGGGGGARSRPSPGKALPLFPRLNENMLASSDPIHGDERGGG